MYPFIFAQPDESAHSSAAASRPSSYASAGPVPAGPAPPSYAPAGPAPAGPPPDRESPRANPASIARTVLATPSRVFNGEEELAISIAPRVSDPSSSRANVSGSATASRPDATAASSAATI